MRKKRKGKSYLNKLIDKFKLLKIKSGKSTEQKRDERIEEKSPLAANTDDSSEITRLKNIVLALQRSRKEFIGLFKNSPEPLIYTDTDGIILEVNKRFERLMGYEFEEVRSKNIKQVLNPSNPYVLDDYRDFRDLEIVAVRKDDKLIQLSISSASNLLDDQILGKVFLLHDITHRKTNEAINNVLYNISRAANSKIVLKELFPVIHRELNKIIDTSNFYIALYDEEKDRLYFQYYVDEIGERSNDFLDSKTNGSESIFYYIFRTGQSLLLNYSKYKKMVAQGNFSFHDVITNKQVWLGVPLKIEDKIIGSMVLLSYTDPNLYSEKDIKLMEFVSQQIATAIERKQIEEKLRFLSLYDSLTKLPNRVLFYDRIKQEIAYAKRTKDKFALLFVDLDNFKQVNDKFGHYTGDELLRETAKRFERLLRETDTVCRVGGDEFIILLPRLKNPKENTEDVVQKIFSVFSEPFKLINNLVNIHLSIGIVLYPDNGEEVEVLIKEADSAMYLAKKKGSNNYCWP